MPVQGAVGVLPLLVEVSPERSQRSEFTRSRKFNPDQRDSPEPNLSIFVSRGDAVVRRVAGDAGEGVAAAAAAVFLQRESGSAAAKNR